MTAPLPAAITAVLAVIVMGGAVLALGTREPRSAILGLLVALSGSPFLADPMPDARGIAARIAGAALAAYLLVIATRDDPAPTSCSPPATWPVAALAAATAGVAATAAVLGWGLPVGPGLPAPAGAPLMAATPFVPAAAAGAALLVLAAGPILAAAEPLRLATGLVLAGAATSLVVTSVGGPVGPFADLCLALLLAAIAGAGALLHRISRRSGPRPAR